jgi:phage shock protein C
MMENDSSFRSPNPYRLYRDPDQGRIAGVCAGIANFLGVSPTPVRLAMAVGVVFFTPLILPAYLVAALALPVRPRQLFRGPEEEAFWRAVSIEPDRTLAGLAKRFKDFEGRVAGLEACVSSKDYELTRAIRDLDR